LRIAKNIVVAKHDGTLKVYCKEHNESAWALRRQGIRPRRVEQRTDPRRTHPYTAEELARLERFKRVLGMTATTRTSSYSGIAAYRGCIDSPVAEYAHR
jgi:hypothetical protein